MASLGATLLAAADQFYTYIVRKPRRPKPVALDVLNTPLASPRPVNINGQVVIVDSIQFTSMQLNATFTPVAWLVNTLAPVPYAQFAMAHPAAAGLLAQPQFVPAEHCTTENDFNGLPVLRYHLDFRAQPLPPAPPPPAPPPPAAHYQPVVPGIATAVCRPDLAIGLADNADGQLRAPSIVLVGERCLPTHAQERVTAAVTMLHQLQADMVVYRHGRNIGHVIRAPGQQLVGGAVVQWIAIKLAEQAGYLAATETFRSALEVGNIYISVQVPPQHFAALPAAAANNNNPLLPAVHPGVGQLSAAYPSAGLPSATTMHLGIAGHQADVYRQLQAPRQP